MVHRKLSDKFKIIAAVLAVVVVAAAAVAYTALSSNGNDVQNALSAGQSRANDLGVTIVSTENSEPWSTTLSGENAPEIGTYDYDIWNDTDALIYSTVTVSSGHSISDVEVVGKTFSGENIDESTAYREGSSIIVSQAGIYTVTVTLDDDADNPVKFYAQVGKMQLSPTAFCTNTTYDGNSKNLSVMSEVAQRLPLGTILNLYGEGSITVTHKYFNESSSSGLAVNRLNDFAADNIRFSVTNAGTYTVNLEIQESAANNYEWSNSDNRFTTCSIVINQAEVSGRVSAEASYEFKPALTVEELISKVTYQFNGAAGNVCNAEIKLYTDNTYSTEVTDLHRGQTIYAKAVKLTSKGTDVNAYRNYRLPENNSLTCSFRLSASILPSITVVNDYYYSKTTLPEYTNVTVNNSNIVAPYFGFDYQISQWFYHSNTDTDNWTVSLENNGHNQGEYWKVTLQTAEGEKVIDPKTEKFRNAGTYRITIKPLDDNYEFNGVTEYNITLTIQPFTLDAGYIEWIDNKERVYTGEPIPMTNKDYKLELWGDDKLELVLSYGDGVTPVNAGKYGNIKVVGLEGESKANYKLPLSDITNGENNPFIIYKQELPEFTGISVVTGVFNGSQQSFDIKDKFIEFGLGHLSDTVNEDGTRDFVSGVGFVGNVVRSYPQDWGLGNATFNNDATIRVLQYFDYTYAGSYTVVLAMQGTMEVNYCWHGGNQVPGTDNGHYTWENFALIERAEIDPTLHNSHISVADDDVNFNEIFNGTLVENGVIVYTLVFGVDGSDTTSDTPLDKDNDGKYVAGEYFVLINIKDEFYPSCYFKAPAEGDGYTINGKQATVNYIVSSNTASFSVKAASYTFGANFASDFNTGKVFTVTTSVMEGVTYGAPTFAYYTDSARTQLVEESALINGVPRNAGKYYVVVTVNCTFADGNTETSLTRNCEFTVTKRQVTLAWKFDGSVTEELSKTVIFNNAEHTVAVANTNTIAGVTNVTITLDNASATNASDTAYVFNVTGITGDEADNYTLEGVSNKTFTLTINRAQVTVTASDVTDITFGDTLILPSPAYEITSGQFYDNEHNGKLSVVVYNNGGSLVNESNYNKLSRGSYVALPVWETAYGTKPTLTDANSYTVTLDNYVVTMVADAFSVNSQEIIVTLYNGASSVYGEAVDLYVPYASGSGIYSTNIEISVEDFKDIVEITAKNKNNVSATSIKAPVGDYTLSAVAKSESGDYKLTVKHNQGNKSVYKITPRALTVNTISVEHQYGNYYGFSIPAYTTEGLLEGDSIDFTCVAKRLEGRVLYDTDISTEQVSTESRKYYLIPTHSSISLNASDLKQNEENGKYYYNKTIGNYDVTAYVGDFVIVPRAITLTFTSGSIVYGNAINLWAQSNVTGNDRYSKYTYCQATGLRVSPENDNLKDVIDLVLVKDGVANSLSIPNAGTYSFKATIKNENYVILNGENRVTELTGGQFVVNPKGITVVTSTTASSIVYGNDLTGITLGFTVNGLVTGDTKEGLGIVVGIYDGETKITDVSAQNVGDYKVGVSEPTNGNYTVTGVTKENFSITKRSATITAVNVTNHVYGEALGANELTFTPEAKSATRGFVSDAHWQALGVTPSVSGDAAKFAVNGSYAISLSKANDNTNYNITLTSGTFTVVKRQITVTPAAVNEHVYGNLLGENELSKTITRNNGTGDAIVNGDNLEIVLKVYDGETDVTNKVATLAVKTYTIKVEYKANANYAVTVNTADFKVIKLKATITFNTSASSVYGEAVNLKNAYSIDGLLSGDVGKEVVTAKLNGNGVEASSTSPAGTYTVVVTIDENYEITYVNHDANNHGKYTITKRAVTVTATDVASHTYGESYNVSNLAYTVAVTNGTGNAIVGSDNLDIVKGIYDGTTKITDVSQLNVKTGGYTIKLSKGASSNANYDITLVDGKFTVVQREITVTFVPATTHVGSEGVYHTVYFADDQDSNIVDNTLYSSAVITLGANDLANGAALRSVLSLSAVNGTHNATETHAPAGNYTITPTVIDCNYKLKNSAVTGVYVIGKAQLTMTSSYPIVTGKHGYTGAAQYILSESVSYSSVNGSTVTVLYKVTTEAYAGTPDETFFADGTTALPTVTNVGVYYLYVLAKADDNHETAKISLSYEIVPVTLTVTAKPVTLTYHDELTLSNWYEYAVTTNATVTPYAGLNADVLNTYLGKLTSTTNYTTSTNAGAAGITIAPVYDNGSNGDNNVIVNCVAGAVTVNKANITINSVTSGHANGAYTGAAFNLFGTMSATTVNNQAIAWYYREVGQTDSDWKLYNNDELTNVCSKQYQVKAVANNHNDNIYGTAINFVIAKNSITIKADDKEITYGDALSKVSFTGQLDGSANNLQAAKVNEYINAAVATYSVSGYTVKTAAGTKLDIVSSYTGDANVQVTVTKGTLTVTTRELTVTFDNSKSSVYGVQVTETVVNSLCGVIGLVNNDTVTVTAKKGETSLTSNKAPAGIYTVTVAASDNYTITYANGTSGAYEITKRVITATLVESSVTYTEDGSDYHNGAYGAAHNATVTFGNLVSGEALNVNNGYTLSYNTTASNGQVAGAAPTKVGEYEVTVTLDNANYTFADDKTSVALDFEVVKKVIDASQIAWNQATIEYIDNTTKQDNYINGYVSAIMQIVSITQTTAQQKQNDTYTVLTLGNSETANCYYFDGNGVLHIVALGRAEYNVIFNLNSDAQANYEFGNMPIGKENIELAFYVVTENITMTVNSAGWQYLDIIKDETINLRINGVSPAYGFSYEYAPVKAGVDLSALLQKKAAADYGGFDEKEVSGLYETDAIRKISLPQMSGHEFDVGYYVLRVTYDTFDHASSEDIFRAIKYDIVKISPKQLKLYTTLEGTTFSGTDCYAEVKFSMPCDSGDIDISDLVTATFEGSTYAKGDNIRKVNAGVYNILYSIIDTEHYVWADEMNAVNGIATVTWTIAQDTAENTNGKYFSVDSIDSTYGEIISKVNPTAKTGYVGTFTWYFANKGSLTNVSEVSNWTEWNETDKPVNAGDYFVKIILTARVPANFTDKVGYGELAIDKADLHITLSGTLEYGTGFGKTYCKYSVVESDLVDSDKGNTSIVKGSGITYYLVDDEGIEISDTTKLEVGTYNLSAGLSNGKVHGLSADNYYILLASGYGKFTVTPKEITVIIGNASSQYGLEPDVTNVDVTYAGLDADVVVAGVKAALKTGATAASEVRDANYTITSDYKNNNFVINYENGVYTITPREVKVTLNNGNGAYSDSSSFNSVTVATILDNSDADVTAFVNGKYVITVVYNGTANDGKTTYTNVVDYPTLAGSYTATAQGDANNKNFTLINGGSANFVVSKFVVDSAKITTETTMYDGGNAITPKINDENDYNGVTVKIYDVQLPEGGCKDADTYTLTLVLTDAANYEWKDNVDTITFEIASAGIYVRPSGSITYGEAVDRNKITFTFILAKTGEIITADSNIKISIDKDKIQLKFVDVIDEGKPLAGEYRLSFDVENGFVLGFKTDNYNFALEKNSDNEVVYGVYKVNKKALTLVADNSESVYSQDVTLAQTYTLKNAEGNSLAWNDQLSDVVKNYKPTSTAKQGSNKGVYEVSATCDEHNNYVIEFEEGKHEIKAIEVKITLTATGGVYGGTKATAKVFDSDITAINFNGYAFPQGFASRLVINITGTQNNGTAYNDGAIPQEAGSYTATVTTITSNDDGNYHINEVVKADFTVAKKVINQEEITIESKPYNGYAQAHGLANGDGYTVSTETYKNVGSHTVTLTLTNQYNYAWTATSDIEVTKQFVITKVKLTLTPYGTFTYGDSFADNQGKLGYTPAGLLGDDKNVVIEKVVIGTPVYALANEPDGSKLNANAQGYDLTLDISGLKADNYDIVAQSGKLVVNKRPITIQPKSSSSVYGEQVVLSNDFDVVAGTLANGDTKSDITYTPSTTATSASNVNEYAVTATASNSNYEIDFAPGVHTIVKAMVGVNIRAINAMYGDAKRAGIEFASVVVIHTNGTTEPINTLKFAVRYVGTANDLSYVDGNEVPTKAGIYTATVTEVLNDNYTINVAQSISSTMFEISKCEIDADKIKAVSAVYTGRDLQPKIEDNTYNVNGQRVYSTVTEGKFIDAGVYDVTLYLRDTDNYCWKDNLNRTTVIKYEIVKADNSLVDANNPQAPASSVKVEISNWTFDGTASMPQASVASGAQNIVFEYAKSENGEYTTEVPKNAGEYYVRATVAASANYNSFTSAPVKFVIGKKTVSLPVVSNLAANSVYTGSMLSLQVEGFDDQIMSLTLDKDMYRADNDGKLNLLALNANTYKAVFKLRDADNYEWESNSQTVDGGVVVNWTVERQVLKVLQSDGRKIVVNGEDIVFMPDGFNSGIMTIRDNVRAHEGKYSAVIVLKDKVNYAWEGVDGDTITVEFELVGTNTVFIALICVAGGLCVGLGAMALILILVQRSKKRKEAEAIDKRSRADGWEE